MPQTSPMSWIIMSIMSILMMFILMSIKINKQNAPPSKQKLVMNTKMKW